MKFIILCHPRTGSTLLITALGRHPSLREGMEIFNPVLEGHSSYVDWRKNIFNEFYGKQDSYVDSIGYLDESRFDLKPVAERFFEDFEGTKIMYDQLVLDSNVWDYVQSRSDIRVIILKRNIVESAVSFRIAMDTNIWHVQNGFENPPCPKMEYPLEFFGWFYDHFCSRADQIAARFDDRIIKRVDYRELVFSWQNTLRSIQQLLEVDPIDIPMLYGKRRTETIEDLIANYAEIRAHYSDHPVLSYHFETADALKAV